MKDKPRIDDRVQVRPMVRVRGQLMGGAIGTVRTVQDSGVVVQTGVAELLFFRFSDVTVLARAGVLR